MKSFGRKQSGGVFKREQRFERTLRQRIEEFHNFKTLATDQLVDNLRSTFPEYARTKMQPFTRQVENAVDRMNHTAQSLNAKKSNDGDRPPAFEFDDEDETNTTPNQSPAYKRVKRTDKSEERLQRIEAQHVIRRQRKGGNDPDRPSTSSSLLDSSASDTTSNDDVYREEMEVKYDLIMSNLRTTYSGSKPKAKSKSKGIQEEEVEVVNNRVAKKVGMSGRRDRIESSRLNNERSNGDDDEKGNEGPRFKDLGGMNGVVDELKMEVIVPLYHPQLPKWLGVKPMAGILLHGPPGCGKTKLAHAIANETGVPFYKISATELVTGVSGASEENIRDLFSKAYRTAPSIVFIDEIDAIASKRENLQREMERRIVTQLMTCMDELHRLSKPASSKSSENSDAATAARPGYVLVIGATNRPDAVDSALRRPGRFDREFVLGVPDEKSRVEILTVLTRNLKLEGDFDLLKIARATPGFVGADLAAVANKAGNLAMKRIIDQRKSEFCKEDNINEGEDSEDWWRKSWSVEEMEKLSITMDDFEEAAKMVQPSSRREGFSAIPNVKWEDVGGLDLLRQEFDRYIVRRIKYPEDYEEFGVDLETGFLLYGPPGCGKTLIAKAVANEAGANFIHIKGPELLNKYVGESELAVRTIFSRARTCAPCILFFDEVDALTTKRGKEGGWVVERLLNQLLIELDGADQRLGVYVIGATNRPEVMDRAVLRPGRFGKLLYVPLPSSEERGLILKALSRKKPIDSNVDLISIGRNESCKNLSGADLSALMNEAAMAALDEKLRLVQTSSEGAPLTIKESHFEQALTKISPSVSDKQKQYYTLLSDSFKAI